MNNHSLEGRVAIVTGGARGIGAAIARALAADGARIVISGMPADASGATALGAELGADRCAFSVSDVGEYGQCQALVAAAIARFGHVDILINNAGITRDKTVRKLAPQDWLDVIRTNLTGPFYMMKAVLDHMVERGYGRIVSISSVIAHTGNIGQANYAASKAGLIGLTKSVALENAKRGITANCVAPGFVETEMVAAMPPQAIQDGIARTPVHRLGKPEEIARAVRFLVDEKASFITGAVLNVNGGYHL